MVNKKLWFVTVLCYYDGGWASCGRETVFVTDTEDKANEYRDGLLNGTYQWPKSSDCDRNSKNAKSDVSIFSCDYDARLCGWQSI